MSDHPNLVTTFRKVPDTGYELALVLIDVDGREVEG